MRISIFFLIVSAIFVSSCLPKEQIVLRNIQNLSVEADSGNDPLLKANAVFFNPNKVRMKLREIKVEIFLNDKKSAASDQKLKALIKPESEFTVPLEVRLSLKEVGLLDTIFSLIGGKKYEIHYLGYIRASVHGIIIKIPIDHRDQVKLKF